MIRCLLLPLAIAVSVPAAATADIALSEDFDGGGVNSTFAFTNNGGPPPSVVDLAPLANAMAAQLTTLTGSNNNSIAFDAVPIQGAQVTLEFDFRMTDDAANAAATGCCNEAADGMGIGFFDTATYGATGALNPASAGQQWETPTNGAGFPAALVMSFDIFDGGGAAGNLVRVTGLAGPTDDLFTGNVPFPLNNNLFHRARLVATSVGADSLLSLELIEDIDGVGTVHPIFDTVTVTGLNLTAVNARLIAGGRTGGAFVQSEIDNIVIDVVQGEDLDNDGIPDFWEEQNEVDDPDDDPDMDNLSNLEEFEAGTDPNDADTDDDGLTDDVETNTGEFINAMNTGTSPVSPDSDGDGLADGVETGTGNFQSPTDTGSDPNVADTDDDQFDDGTEVNAGTDPNNAAEFPATPIDLGTGTASLLGGDLTDPENDGDPENDINYNAVFAASEEPGFAGGEFSFNVFDNVLGPSNDKWCCGGEGGNFPAEPIWVTATFAEPIDLTHFTISSANDIPARDPRVWEIQGSNDEVNFETIFRQDDPLLSIWTARLQVKRFNAGVHYIAPPAYTTIRFICFATGLTGGARYQVGELEYFGVPGNLVPLQFTEVALNGDATLDVTWNSKDSRTYIIEWSTDLVLWNEIDDSYPSGGESTTYNYAAPVGPAPDPAVTPKIFLRVTENEL